MLVHTSPTTFLKTNRSPELHNFRKTTNFLLVSSPPRHVYQWMSAFTVTANTTYKTLHIQLSSASCFGCFLAIITYMTKKMTRRTNLMQQLWFIIISSLYMFRTSICTSSEVYIYNIYIYIFIHSFIQYSVWRQVQSLLQNDAST